LEKSLTELSDDYFNNEKRICEIEKQIRAINDFEVRHLMSKKKIFENLNFEKPSKTFLDIAKSIAKPDNIGVINDDNGQVFNTEDERSVYITNFYSNLGSPSIAADIVTKA
jgi:hypothetical protein